MLRVPAAAPRAAISITRVRPVAITSPCPMLRIERVVFVLTAARS